ncbi:hypothetical protein Q2K19_16000 [Micromonospora soli]|uniref:hypothetical protein n=1 Tax=Micromonospora sp. NBRC 110009 TaxID=3061627 RepID=UPI0026737303|nr:hypothetical protein [Micromonospora sp. NBRC 110009]WKU01868.1 hypothetical protein Q2K19_16000 [Micromonospora sp. NBRC 110009]
MSRELTRLYRALAADTDERALPAPDQLRRRADRQARNRAALGALTAAVLVAGTAVGTRMVLIAGPDAPPGPPAASPTATGTPAPSPTASPSSPVPSRTTQPPSSRTPGSPPPTSAGPTATTAISIPDRAFFALPPANDLGTAGDFVPGPVLPELCGAMPGEGQIAQRRARSLPYRLADAAPASVPDGYYRHSITVYRTGGADEALRELRGAVRDCPEQPVTEAPAVTSTQRLLDGTGYGDESVLFELRNPNLDVEGRPVSGEEVHLVRAIRVGDVVTVLWEQGWEGSSTDRAQFDADSGRAAEALRGWLG